MSSNSTQTPELPYRIDVATAHDAPSIATLVGELLHEIMSAIQVKAFHFDHAETQQRAREFLEQDKYHVFLARDLAGETDLGLIALYPSHALYAEGSFGTIPELYVRPAYRAQGIGRRLLEAAQSFGQARGWKRLEVTTPPLPQYEAALRFYERAGFSITGGRKLKIRL